MAQSGHSTSALHMSAFGGKADIAAASQKCPLMTQSGNGWRKKKDRLAVASPKLN